MPFHDKTTKNLRIYDWRTYLRIYDWRTYLRTTHHSIPMPVKLGDNCSCTMAQLVRLNEHGGSVKRELTVIGGLCSHEHGQSSFEYRLHSPGFLTFCSSEKQS